MKVAAVALGVAAGLSCTTLDAHAKPWQHPVSGFSLGPGYTTADELDGFGWYVAGTAEATVGKACEIRGTLGYMRFGAGHEAENVSYTYLVADVLAGGRVSAGGGIGLYYVHLGEPFVDDAQSSFELGLNAGVRLMIPDSHHHRAFTVDGRAHSAFGDGPSFMITLGAGLVF